MPITSDDNFSARAREIALEVRAITEMLEEYAAFLPPTEVDLDGLAGSGGQAQENRAIVLATVRSAAERAQLARAGLSDIVARARATRDAVLAQGILRRARLRLSATDRTAINAMHVNKSAFHVTEDMTAIEIEVFGLALAVPGIHRAAMTSFDRRGSLTRTLATDEAARALSAIQTVEGGPSREAAVTATPVHAELPKDCDQPWGAFWDSAGKLGVYTALAYPVRGISDSASVTFYSADRPPLDPLTSHHCRLLGRYSEMALSILAEDRDNPPDSAPSS